ncbi:LysR substrate-binding domain-containing protein [Pollutimonas sp. H1-120]|uniref:LysR family transcriptional regulator n=1 Tax=Pollutimonas sp. H1-120 TaxID=3148824 RepID=UPI003B526B1C
MNINQLKYFVALAEELSFTRAARRLHISQPPLSKQIALLEEELAVRLFNRTSRRVELTEAGRIYLYEVKAILARLSRATARARSIEQGMEGIIEVGLSGSHFLGPVPQLIAQCNMLAPGIHLVLNEMRPSDQVQALLDRTIDISIGRSRTADSLLKSFLLWEDPPVLAMLASHPLAERSQLQMEDLVGQRLVLLERDSSSFAASFHLLCTQVGIDLRRSQVVEEVPAQLYLVEAGLGIAVVPISATRRVTGLITRPLNNIPLSTDVYALVRQDNTKTAIWTFIELARKFRNPTPPSAG